MAGKAERAEHEGSWLEVIDFVVAFYLLAASLEAALVFVALRGAAMLSISLTERRPRPLRHVPNYGTVFTLLLAVTLLMHWADQKILASRVEGGPGDDIATLVSFRARVRPDGSSSQNIRIDTDETVLLQTPDTLVETEPPQPWMMDLPSGLLGRRVGIVPRLSRVWWHSPTNTTYDLHLPGGPCPPARVEIDTRFPRIIDLEPRGREGWTVCSEEREWLFAYSAPLRIHPLTWLRALIFHPLALGAAIAAAVTVLGALGRILLKR